MPARTVVIEKLVQVERRDPRRHHAGGVHPAHRPRRPPRPRRRGPRRRAVGARHEPQGVAGLASTRTYPLRSSFRPSYNMAVNLVTSSAATGPASCWSRRSPSSRRTRPSSGWPGSCARARTPSTATARPPPATSATSWSTPRLRRRLSDAEKGASRSRRADRRQEISTRWTAAARGRDRGPDRQVRRDGGRHRPGHAVDRDGPRPYVLTADRQARRLSIVDFPTPVGRSTRMRCRGTSTAATRSRAASWPRAGTRTARAGPPPPAATGGRRHGGDPADDREISASPRRPSARHPCHGCPDREDHARWAERQVQARPGGRDARRRIEQRTNTIARQFDRVCDVLTALEYLEGDTVTERAGPDAHLHRHGPGRRRVRCGPGCGTA